MSKLMEFNIHDAKYALETAAKTWSAPVPFTYAEKLAVSADTQIKKKSGDGKIVDIRSVEPTQALALTLTAVDEAFEIAMKRKMTVTNGIIDIEQKSTPKFALYAEINVADAGEPDEIWKVWYYGIYSPSRPKDTYSQNTESGINESSAEYEFIQIGTNLEALSTTDDYVDSTTGKKIKVWRQICKPTDSNYSTFGNAVPTPKATA